MFAELVATHAGLLDRLNAFPVPDADTGRNLSATMRAALGALGEAPGPASPAPRRGRCARRWTAPWPCEV